MLFAIFHSGKTALMDSVESNSRPLLVSSVPLLNQRKQEDATTRSTG